MTFTVINLKAELQNTVQTQATQLNEDSTEPIDWEWTPPSHRALEVLIGKFEAKVKIGDCTSKIPKQDADEHV